MKKEDKELLLQDLCARLSYGVIVEIISYGQETLMPWFGKLSCKDLDCFIHDVAYKSIKPYLRPLSSMTEEEKEDLLNYVVGKDGAINFEVCKDGYIRGVGMVWVNFQPNTTSRYVGWLLKNHFDLMDLIPKGLALEAPKDMYNEIEEE